MKNILQNIENQLFRLFKSEKKTPKIATDNDVLGPLYLNGFTESINAKCVQTFEWRRQIKSASNGSKFKIKFYGKYHDKCHNLIVNTDFAPLLVIAVDIINAQEILLFDGCQHGYNALFCDIFSKEQIENRVADKWYKDKKGNDVFNIHISAYYQFDFNEEVGETIDKSGFIELINGNKIPFEMAKRNGFDCLQIVAINENGDKTEIVSEELA